MTGIIDPEAYEAWYHTLRGSWIGHRESKLLLELMQPTTGQTLLDVGSGTGYFSRRFSEAGLDVTGIDPDPSMVRYARTQTGTVDYLESLAEQLPFEDNSFDYTAAVTSLCFVTEPQSALAEMWRVSRNGVILGLLNRNSLIYRQKHNHGSYIGARWDRWSDVVSWINQLPFVPEVITHRTAIIFPSAGPVARTLEHILPRIMPWGSFLAVYLGKRN